MKAMEYVEERISYFRTNAFGWGEELAMAQALKAVLEIHQEVPYHNSPTREQRKAGMEYGDPSLAYSKCSCGYVEHYIASDGYSSMSIGTNDYPCPTVIAIEKALGVGE